MAIDSLPSSPSGQITHNDVREKINEAVSAANSAIFNTQILVRTADDLAGNLSSTALYVLDGVIDFSGSGVQITVPAGGLNMRGQTKVISGLKSTDNSFDLFVSPPGGSGPLFAKDLHFEISGVGSSVMQLNAATGNETIEFHDVNYVNCSDIGEITNYTQVIETGTGRFFKTPTWTFSGNMDGVRISTSVVRLINNLDALFKAGTGLSFGGRFITDINCDLPSAGALLDFSPSNFQNNQSLLLQNCFITRNGVSEPTDSTITPNINQNSDKSNWQNNIGIQDTVPYLTANVTTAVPTTISALNAFTPILGTFTVTKEVQLSMPSNGEFAIDAGRGVVKVSGDIVILGTPGDALTLRATKSTDGGVTWPEELGRTRRVVNNFSGANDLAFFNVNLLITDLKPGDLVRVEVTNETTTNNVTMQTGSYLTFSK